MKVLLNYGAGVNSTAMMIKIAEQECWKGNEIHCVFSDTGCEHPETMQYIEEYAKPFCEEVGFKFVTVSRNTETLIEYCRKARFVPSRRFRWCTDKFKQRPIREYQKEFKPDISLIGIDAGEEHRAKTDDPTVRFPLIEAGIDREDCITIIKLAGLPVPIKSGCYICPYTRKNQWGLLKRDHPDLFRIAVELENNASDQKFKIAHKTLTLEEWLKDYVPRDGIEQERLFEIDKDMPCFCMAF